jgi:hypothetical protein
VQPRNEHEHILKLKKIASLNNNNNTFISATQQYMRTSGIKAAI